MKTIFNAFMNMMEKQVTYTFFTIIVAVGCMKMIDDIWYAIDAYMYSTATGIVLTMVLAIFGGVIEFVIYTAAKDVASSKEDR